MNAKKFSDAMSELDTKYVDEALNYKKKAKKPICKSVDEVFERPERKEPEVFAELATAARNR